MRCGPDDAERIYRVLADPSISGLLYSDEHEGLFHIGLVRGILGRPECYLLLPHSDCVLEFLPMGDNKFDGHVAVLPTLRGPARIGAIRSALRWMFENSDCEQIEAKFADYNRPGILLMPILGFKRAKVEKDSWRKNGKVYDQVVYRLSKGEFNVVHQQHFGL